MEVLKQDITKLYSLTDFAKMKGVTLQTVYIWLNDSEKKRTLKVVEISGKCFIKLSA